MRPLAKYLAQPHMVCSQRMSARAVSGVAPAKQVTQGARSPCDGLLRAAPQPGYGNQRCESALFGSPPQFTPQLGAATHAVCCRLLSVLPSGATRRLCMLFGCLVLSCVLLASCSASTEPSPFYSVCAQALRRTRASCFSRWVVLRSTPAACELHLQPVGCAQLAERLSCPLTSVRTTSANGRGAPAPHSGSLRSLIWPAACCSLFCPLCLAWH